MASDKRESVNAIETEIRAVDLALGHYRAALKIEQHPHEHVSDQADDNEIRRWVALGDAILSRGAPAEQQISEMISLARNEQARIKRKMRPIVRIFKQSQSKH